MQYKHKTEMISSNKFVLEIEGVFHIMDVSVASYSACRAYAPYCHLWSVWLDQVFPHYLIKVVIFGKKLLNIKCVF